MQGKATIGERLNELGNVCNAREIVNPVYVRRKCGFRLKCACILLTIYTPRGDVHVYIYWCNSGGVHWYECQ